MTEHIEQVKHFGDVLSVGTVVASIIGLLPDVATLFTVIWLAIRIYETKTVQKILKRHKGPDVE